MKQKNIRELQLSALSRINFCFYQLKQNPPLQWINSIINNESLEETKENYLKLDSVQQAVFNQ